MSKEEISPELNYLATRILDAAFTVHKNLGPGLLESAYQLAMEAEFYETGIPFHSQKEMPLEYKGKTLATAYRLDLYVAEQIVVELKSVEALNDVHIAQTLTYMKLSGSKLGLLLNFNVKLMKYGLRRLVL